MAKKTHPVITAPPKAEPQKTVKLTSSQIMKILETKLTPFQIWEFLDTQLTPSKVLKFLGDEPRQYSVTIEKDEIILIEEIEKDNWSLLNLMIKR